MFARPEMMSKASDFGALDECSAESSYRSAPIMKAACLSAPVLEEAKAAPIATGPLDM